MLNLVQAKDSDDDDDDVTVTVDRDRFMDEFFEQVGARLLVSPLVPYHSSLTSHCGTLCAPKPLLTIIPVIPPARGGGAPA